MRSALSILVSISWAIWFGGMVMLFLFVSVLFHQNRSLAVETAPILFRVFEQAQLILACVAIAGTFFWWLITRRRAVMTLFALLALGGAIAATSTTLVTSRMEILRQQDQSDSPEFRSLHGRSMIFYVTEAFLLLNCGIVLTIAIRDSSSSHQRSRQVPRSETTDDTARA